MIAHLRNGIPIDVQDTQLTDVFGQRVGDESICRVVKDGCLGAEVHVILLRGTGKKRYLVEVKQLRKQLDEINERALAEAAKAREQSA